MDFGLTIGTEEEKLFRLDSFAQKDQYISDMNSAGNSFTVGHNQFSTWSHEEYQSMLLKGKLMSNESLTSKKSTSDETEIVDLPDKVDWRTSGYISPVMNQGTSFTDGIVMLSWEVTQVANAMK